MRHEKTIDELSQHYNRNISHYGPTIHSLQWINRESQHIRFDILMQSLPAHYQTLCDVGCGLGDLYHYIKNKKIPIKYRGIDISSKMIISAQNAYPDGHFSCLDLDIISKNNTFDCLIASGVFNIRLKNHDESVFTTIHKMIECARFEVRFNMLSHKVKKRDQSTPFVYRNPESIKNHFEKHVKKVTIIENYLPNDFTCILVK
ncbi:hypothetical protein DID78_01505 [Candidatus Marinamargulisbacteria bacterium SCGC AG-343-D04]|nr:hypothetical protein DID78_01505 [Candidatus Marinamargulisbacteria bacterium SCGC AG-343-D04]